MRPVVQVSLPCPSLILHSSRITRNFFSQMRLEKLQYDPFLFFYFFWSRIEYDKSSEGTLKDKDVVQVSQWL